MLENTWREIDYRLDVPRATKGAHVEVYWCVVKKKKLLELHFEKKKCLYSTYSSVVINVCNQGKTLRSPFRVPRMNMRERKPNSGPHTVWPHQTEQWKRNTNSAYLKRRQLASKEKWVSEQILERAHQLCKLHRPVFLNRRAAARYRALASIIPGRERFSWNFSF